MSVANCPSNIDYFNAYFDNPKSIARYKVMEVRGSLGKVASANAEADHASNKAAVPSCSLKSRGFRDKYEVWFKVTTTGSSKIKRSSKVYYYLAQARKEVCSKHQVNSKHSTLSSNVHILDSPRASNMRKNIYKRNQSPREDCMLGQKFGEEMEIQWSPFSFLFKGDVPDLCELLMILLVIGSWVLSNWEWGIGVMQLRGLNVERMVVK